MQIESKFLVELYYDSFINLESLSSVIVGCICNFFHYLIAIQLRFHFQFYSYFAINCQCMTKCSSISFEQVQLSALKTGVHAVQLRYSIYTDIVYIDRCVDWP